MNYLIFSGNLKMYDTEKHHCLAVTNETHPITSIDCDEKHVVTSNPEDYISCHEIPSLNLLKKRDLPSKGISNLMIRKGTVS